MIQFRVNRSLIRALAQWQLRITLMCVFAFALLWLAWADAQTVQAEPPWPDPPFGTRTQIPVLSFVGQESTSQTLIQVQNVGSEFTRAIILIWGEAGACGPQAVGPFKVECSGIIKPGATWMFGPQQTPPGAKSGIVYTFPQRDIVTDDGKVFTIADAFCERLFSEVTFDADAFRRFDLAFREGRPITFGAEDNLLTLPTTGGQPVAVDVVRIAQGTPSRDLTVSGAYAGVTGPEAGAFDPVFGGFAYYAPIVYADSGGLTSWVYIQNSGLDCTGVELWFQEQNDCLRAQICEIITLAPGETAQYNVSDCVGPSFVGSLWLRTSQPSGVVVDHIGQDVLMTDKGVPARNEAFDAGSEVLFGPLIYREFQGWETSVSVQNLSGTQQGMVKVYFYDESGNIITTLVDWVCPRATQTFFLPVINGLPGQYVGAVRIESLTAFRNAGSNGPFVPIAAVAHLRKYTDPTTSQIQEAISYNLFGEPAAFDWQIGPGKAGLIGVPSVLKQGRNLSTELAIQNVNPNPGFTDFVIYLYDPNGLLEVVCEKLSAYNVEYINFNSWGIINPGFVGSAIISGVYTNQPGGFGLTAVAIERVQSILQFNTPGDESSGFEAFPIFTENFDFEGFPVQCPGQPGPCTFALFGQVVESLDLRPINGARVIVRTGGFTVETTTDSTGHYFVEVPAGLGDIAIRAQHPEHVAKTITIGRIECGGVFQQNFELDPLDASIGVTGFVFDKETGEPIEGAAVEATNCTNSASATTNADGFYTIDLEFDPDCTTTVIASAEGYTPSADSVFIPKGSAATIDFQLHQTPKSRVLLYFGNGGVGPGEIGGGAYDYFTLQTMYEDLGFLVDYTDVWPSDPDLEEYQLVVLILPGFDNDQLPDNAFSAGQASQLGNFIANGGRVVLLTEDEEEAGAADDDYNVQNDLLDRLGIGIDVSGRDDGEDTYFKDVTPAPYDAEFAPTTLQGQNFQELDLSDGAFKLYQDEVATTTAAVELTAAFRLAQTAEPDIVIAADKVGSPNNAPDQNASTGWDVVVMGDAQILDDEFLTAAFPENRAFAINLISFPTVSP